MEKSDIWAIVELFGHQRIAGKVSEYNLGGSFIRVDVPAVMGRQPFTKLYGQNAIYAISFVDKDVCIAYAEKLQAVPVMPYEVASLTTDAVRNRLSIADSQDKPEDDIPF